MDPRQAKQHDLLKTILSEASAELPEDNATAYQLANLDFETALSALIERGSSHDVSAAFWWNLKKAAELLGLRDLYSPLRQKRLLAMQVRAS